MSERATIYVALLDEAVDVWRPVEAEAQGGDRYKIVGVQPAGERWAFPAGAEVVCVQKRLENGLVWVADGWAK